MQHSGKVATNFNTGHVDQPESLKQAGLPNTTLRARKMSQQSRCSQSMEGHKQTRSKSRRQRSPKEGTKTLARSRGAAKQPGVPPTARDMGAGFGKTRTDALKVAPVSDREVSPETIHEDSVPASPTLLRKNATILMSDQVKQHRQQIRPHEPDEALGLARQASEVQLEERIQPAGKIDNIKKNRHQKMMSGAAAETAEPLTAVAGKRLSLRLSNLRVFTIAAYQDPQNLTHIDLRNNRLASLPDQLCDLRQLAELRLDYNFLASLPHRIHRLTNLTYLSASQNSLKAVPATIVHLSRSLRHLHLNDNKIVALQAKLGNLRSLETLLLHQNMIVDVPSTLYRLRSLSEFSLDWFGYLNAEFVGIHTKHLKARVDREKCSREEY